MAGRILVHPVSLADQALLSVYLLPRGTASENMCPEGAVHHNGLYSLHIRNVHPSA
jgi:hypothetical protein